MVVVNGRYLLGIDIGTSSCKGVLVDLKGRILGSHSTKYTLLQPKPGWAEHDPEVHWWGDLVLVVRRCLQQSGVDPRNIAGVSVSGMVPNLCALDSDGRPVRPAILYRDNRAVAEVQELNSRFNLSLGAADVVPKLLWLKRWEPENYRRTHVILNAHSYIIYKLTGIPSADCDTANTFGGIFDSERLTWRTDLVSAMGLDPQKLPPIFRPTDVVGRVTAEAARATGLAPGIPVVAGNGDSFMSLVGTGVVHAHEAMIYLGTAATMFVCLTDLEKVASGPAISGGYARFVANILTGGELTRWFREQLIPDEEMPNFAALEAMAQEIPPGSEGLIVLPHFMGKRTPESDPLARGVILGLTTAHGGAHLYRAFMEAVGFAIRDCYEREKVSVKRLAVTGGGACSRLWRQIIADILGMSLEYRAKADAALGNAYFAGFALGYFTDFNAIEHEWLEVDEVTTVNSDAHRIYERYFDLYRSLDTLMKPAYHLLAQGLEV
ncbi:FGGY family carbohydrate kinase [Moorellaceae bacterium AZ2]